MEENLGRASAIETGTKLYISNLDYGVSNEDIKVLFYISSLVVKILFFQFWIVHSLAYLIGSTGE
jgi:hypothetical protein